MSSYLLLTAYLFLQKNLNAQELDEGMQEEYGLKLKGHVMASFRQDEALKVVLNLFRIDKKNPFEENPPSYTIIVFLSVRKR